MNFLDALKEKVLIFDGAMGTSIHSYELSLDDYQGHENCSEILVESRPDVIAEIHAAYLAAGCDAIETNSFGGSAVVLGEFGLAQKAYEINYQAAQLAKKIAADFSSKEHPRYVSGSIGPTTKLPTLGHISFKDLYKAYYTQVSGLVDGGVDVLQFETGQDLLQAKAAVLAMVDYFKHIGKSLPVITQVTIEPPPSGTMLVGSDISVALTVLSSLPVDVIGMNCATGPLEMTESLRYLSEHCPRFISVLPNAGLPENIGGKTVYKLTPEELAKSLLHFARDLGVNIIGGCCGTTPRHLKKVCEIAGGLSPTKRKIEATSLVCSLYTTIPLHLDPSPLMVGERANTNGSRTFKELLVKEDWEGMVSLARRQEHEGAHLIDVCTAYVGRNEEADMRTLITKLNTKVQLPLLIDTTEYAVLETSLQCITGRPIVNSVNLEDGEESLLKKLHLIKRFGAATIALTIDEEGMAKTADKKLAIARRIYYRALEIGLAPYDLIFDALTFTLSTGNAEDRRLGLETLNAIRSIKEAMPGVKTILGVSNISFGFEPRIRHVLNSVFMHYAVEHGLDMAIVNASKIMPLYKIDEKELEYHRKLIFDERTPNYDPLFAMLDFYKGLSPQDKAKTKVVEAPKTIEESLKRRIIDGNRTGLEKDLDTALKKYDPLNIINEILLSGMKEVGELFGSGKMQLPFVLQSAETMKASVTYLEQFMEKKAGTTRGTLILATVKGDVHDIGKNLVDIILSNNGYQVINLGIRQPIENIISAAREHKAHCIGMSGLLVRSTQIMKENLEIMNEHGLHIPVILGGAALTRRYVEEECRKVYNGPVFYGLDAFTDLRTMENIAQEHRHHAGPNSSGGAPASTDVDTGGRKSIGTGGQKPAFTDPPKDASSRRPVPTSLSVPKTQSDVATNLLIPTPPFWGSCILEDIPLKEVFPLLNENVIFRGRWQVRQRDMSDADYQKLLEDKIIPAFEELKKRCLKEQLLVPKAVYGYFPCQSQGNDLIVMPPDSTPSIRITFPRQDHGRHLCIADFYAGEGRDEGVGTGGRKPASNPDVLPLLIVTAGEKATEFSQELLASGRYTDYLYFHGLSVETAEGIAEWVHKLIRKELKVGDEDAPDKKTFLNQGYRGTRFSFGYPACPNLEDQELIFKLLKPERIGITLTEEFQLVPEQSTSAIVSIHPEAKYFNITAPGNSSVRK